MKNKILFLAVSVLLLVFANSCEVGNNSNTLDIASRLEGKWAVTETSSLFKSAKDAYNVYITIDEIDSTTIYISNFYEIGGTYDVKATINGSNLNIPTQTVNGSVFSGTGLIAKNYKTITWKYKVAYESGDIDNVDATYEKVE